MEIQRDVDQCHFEMESPDLQALPAFHVGEWVLFCKRFQLNIL